MRFLCQPNHGLNSILFHHLKRNIFNLQTALCSSGRNLSHRKQAMVRVLNVAEKNDAAKSITSVLSQGRSSMREGFSRFNKIYEFDYRLMNQQVKMSMTSVSGHLLGLEFCGIFKKWGSCNPVDLFSLPVEKYCSDNYKDIKRTLEREIRGCQTLVIWTDCDREGENIGFEIIDVCKAVKPGIKVYRATFSEITPHAVQRAINNLGPPDVKVSQAVDVRQELDLRIGAAFTRFQTLRLQRIFPEALNDQLISYGSCQFPTLGFVVERYKQVNNFIPEPFWKLRVTHRQEGGQNAEFNWKRVRLFNQLACQVLHDQCVESGVAEVTDVRSKNKSKWRPVALDTVELEKLASRKLRINAKEAMQIAEKLYTKGFISYPRTETNMFPKELDLNNLVQQHCHSNEWGAFAQDVLEKGPNPRNGTKTDKAHPPIHPLKFTDSLQGNEGKLYEFVVRHFLACVSADAQGHETTVEITVAREVFTTSGLMIIARNYLDVYPYDKWNAKEIPVYTKDNVFRPDKIEMLNGETSPPPLLTEADLIALMDKHGIGTDATHAEHIETVKARMYIGTQADGRFVPGQLGMGLVEGYDSMGFEMSKPHLRAELEADLKHISEGRKDKDDVLQRQISKYKEIFIKAAQQAKKLDEALVPYLGQAQTLPDHQEPASQVSSVIMDCPNCKKPMTLRTTKDGSKYYVGCSGYPECKSSHWFPDSVMNVRASEQQCHLCQPKTVTKLHFKFKPGRVPPSIPTEYLGCIGGCDEMLTQALGLRNLSRNGTFIPYSQVTPLSSGGTTTTQPRHNQTTTTSNRTTSNRPNVNSRTGSGSSNASGGSQQTSFHSWSANTPNPSGSSGVNQSISSFPGTQNRNTSSRNDSGFQSGRPTQSSTGRFTNSNDTNNSGSGRSSQTSISSFFGSQSSQNRNTNTAARNPPSNVGRNLNSSNNGGMRVKAVGTGQGIGGDDGVDSGQAIVCNCGKDAILLTVRKDGPNQGRQFYKCFNQGDDNCNFFLWANESSSSSSPSAQPNNRPSSSMMSTTGKGQSFNRPFSDSSTDDTNCNCGLPAKSLTVMKNGPNMGRPFYGCSKPREESCNFFKWGDDSTGSSDRQTGPSGSNKRVSNVTSTQTKKRNPPTCGLCGMPGHRRPKCPLNDE